MRSDPPAPGFSREESRYLDDELSADEARRMERRLTADPDATDRVGAYRRAMDLWREDAGRVAGTLAGDDALSDRVLGALRDGPPPRLAVTRSAPWYAAAALLLITVGLAGTLLSSPAAHGTREARRTGFIDLEDAMMELMIDGPEFSPPLASAGGSHPGGPQPGGAK